MFVEQVRAAYDARAQEYAERFGSLADRHPIDRAMLTAFVEQVMHEEPRPRVADLGCGPGLVTAYLQDQGMDAFGIDLSPELVAHARAAHPRATFRVGDLGRLDLADGALDGLVAWYSLIHTPPEALPRQLDEIARVLRPGGILLLAGQASEGDQPRLYDHRVVAAYTWPVDALAHLLAQHGLDATYRATRRAEPEERTDQLHLLARRA